MLPQPRPLTLESELEFAADDQPLNNGQLYMLASARQNRE